VVYRNQWASLLALPWADQQSFMRASSANLQAQLKQAALRPWPHPVLPIWAAPQYVFDGITLWFDGQSVPAASQAAFHRLYREFVNLLAKDLRAMDRPITLNLVVPEQSFGRPGPYRFEDMAAHVEGRPAEDPPQDIPDNFEPKPGKLDMHLMLLLPEATTVTKKELRARIDKTEVVKGRRRVNLLDHIVPVNVMPAHPAQGALERAQPLDDDLAYFQWVYGGVSLWQLPRATGGADPILLKRLQENYPTESHWAEIPEACTWVCPNRELVRLALEVSLFGCLVGVAVLCFTDLVQNKGRWVQLLLLLPLIAAAVLSFGLLSCDPEWLPLRTSMGPWALLGLVLLGGLIWMVLRRRVPPP
jgi:hypothetical protein